MAHDPHKGSSRMLGKDLSEISGTTKRKFKGLYINDSLHLARKYARISVRGHDVVLEKLKTVSWKVENCELWGTDNVQGQISVYQMETIVLIILRIFFATRAILKIWGISLGYSPVLAAHLFSILSGLFRLTIFACLFVNLFFIMQLCYA